LLAARSHEPTTEVWLAVLIQRPLHYREVSEIDCLISVGIKRLYARIARGGRSQATVHHAVAESPVIHEVDVAVLIGVHERPAVGVDGRTQRAVQAQILRIGNPIVVDVGIAGVDQSVAVIVALALVGHEVMIAVRTVAVFRFDHIVDAVVITIIERQYA